MKERLIDDLMRAYQSYYDNVCEPNKWGCSLDDFISYLIHKSELLEEGRGRR